MSDRRKAVMSRESLEDLLDCIEWYRECLDDFAHGRVVRGLAEAEAGYLSAMREIQDEMGHAV